MTIFLELSQSKFWWLIILTLVWLTTFCIIVLEPRRISQDAALEIHTTQLMLYGWRPYVDFVHQDEPTL